MSVSPATNESTTAEFGCNCIDLTNEAMKEHNTEIARNWAIDRNTGRVMEYVAIQTEVVTKKRGARPKSIIPTFCPFCGRRYQPETDGTS